MNSSNVKQSSLNKYFTKDQATDLVQPVTNESPQSGSAILVADGIWWTRFEVDSIQDHVNAYILEDPQGWTIVDTGSNTEACIKAIESLLSSQPFCDRPMDQVICTHYHPDHVGLAGWFAQRGVRFVTTRTCWLNARLLQMDNRQTPSEEKIEFFQRAGLPAMELEAYRRRRPSQYSDLVNPLPLSYRRIQCGDVLKIGKRLWTVRVGNGHASEHATLWSGDAIAIVGDQILPTISPNLSVHPSEPEADLVSEWIESCQRLAKLASDETIALPGHGFPFVGVRKRCEQLIANVNLLLDRLMEFVSVPRTAIQCLPAIYRRDLQMGERDALIAEAIGLLNHLLAQGKVRRDLVGHAFLWSRVNSSPLQFKSESGTLSNQSNLVHRTHQKVKGNHAGR